MNLANYYYYFQSAVPARICDEIVKSNTNKRFKKEKKFKHCLDER
jgi:hypothetical protein